MANINLLPWREQLRKQKQRQFIAQIIIAAILAGAAAFTWKTYVDELIHYQEARNAFLKEEIKRVERKIKEIEDLEKEREQLISRMNVIQELQASRPLIVHLFDELVNTLPDGVFLKEVSQTGNKVYLVGRAQSNARVSAYMRNIDESDWLTKPQLKIIESNDKTETGLSHFELTAEQKNPYMDKKS